ncbi:hypothetical protein [Neisseria bergeri]|uniref:hypothetical protein n=2 Tax=Neisseria bergeri TaxID=1906581 RepID=UPI0027E17109|nr:hypothetical protein [Neisseria bergeri]
MPSYWVKVPMQKDADNVMALGTDATVSAENAVAVGNGANTGGKNTVAVGASSRATKESGGIAIGLSARTKAILLTQSVTNHVQAANTQVLSAQAAPLPQKADQRWVHIPKPRLPVMFGDTIC